MQTTTLPIQVSGAGPANAPQRQNTGSGASEFGATLAREMAQRSAPSPAPQAPKSQPAPKAQQPQQAQAPKQQQDDAAPDEAQASVQDPATAATAQDAGKAKATDGSTDTDKQATGDEQVAASSPAADMLALMASFSQLQKAAAGAGKDSKDTLQTVAAKTDTAQTALQATLKRLSAQDDSSASHGKAGADLAADAQQQGALGVTAGEAGAAHTDTAGDGIDLRAAFGADTRGKTEPADFGAKAREIAAKLETIAPTAAPLPVQAQLQAAAVEAARPGAAAAEHLSARVGSTEWDKQVGQKIVWMVGSEEQTASLTLNPPDLGPMQVVLSVTGDQASVAFSASHEDVRHALESALPRLREMMGESGIELGSATVSTGMPDQRQAQGEQGGSGARGGGNGSFAANAGGGDANPQVSTRVTSAGDGLVDTFA
jgi:flagellar hook-length control protein FliK